MIPDSIRILVENGFAVHLLKPRSKAPAMGAGWSTQSVLSVEELEEQYKKGQGFGVRLGAPSLIGDKYLHTIDMDIRVDEELDDALSELHGLFPDVDSFACVKSGSGGNSRHFYFLSDMPFSSKKLAHSKGFFKDEENRKHWNWEIELFGTGKQVVLPPSLHPETGKPYEWLHEFDFDELIDPLPFVSSEDMPEAVSYSPGEGDKDDGDDLLELLTPPRGLSLDEIRELLDALPADEWCEDREKWLTVGMAVHHETRASDEGFDLWSDWSAQSAKFDPEDSRRVWKSFRPKANKITIGTILKVVRDTGLDFDQCKRRLERTTSYRDALSIIAAYDFMPSEVSELTPELVRIAGESGRKIKLTDASKDVKLAIKEARLRTTDKVARSIEQWLADETLRLFFDNGRHLISFNGSFWVYDGGYWYRPDQNTIASKVIRVIEQALGAGDEISEPLRVALRASGRGDSMNALSNAIVGVLQKTRVLDNGEDPLGLCRQQVPSVMNCTNGELWFGKTDFSFKKHNPDHLFTHQLATEYDNTAECPEWDAALKKLFADKEDTDDVIRHLYELMGYIIQGQRNMAAWALFYGNGRNGKSFVSGVLMALMGHKAWASKSLADYSGSRNTHIEAGLVGKLLLVDDDFKKGALLPDDTLKKLSETKPVTANPKGSDEFNFICRTVPLILANSWPKTEDTSYGLERRALVFHFSTRIKEEEVDEMLKDRIIDNELPGILNHLVAGWRRLRERGRFLEPASCKRAKATWLNSRNSLAMFLAEHVDFSGDQNDRVPAQDVWQAFQLWGEADNLHSRWGRTRFYDEIASVEGVVSKRPSGIRNFYGLRLKNTDRLGGYFELDDLDDEDLETIEDLI